MNPYRSKFYSQQAGWHGYTNTDVVRAKHEQRLAYYDWYTRGWLPENKHTPILDIACGSGQFVYFLKQRGYTDVTGIDLDQEQVGIAQELGLNCLCEPALDFLEKSASAYGLIAMMDILEHFTREELFRLMELVAHRLDGHLVVSVPNAESPAGLYTRYSDITHELSFSPTSLSELLFCHGMKAVAFRDPWPAPVTLSRKLYRWTCLAARKVETARLRLLGLGAPRIWSPVFWAKAEKRAV